MKKLSIAAGLVLAALVAPAAQADWHGGVISQINIGYDGRTITFALTGHNRADCTCYAAWANTLCLDRNRDTFTEEVAMLYSARARGTVLYANINEATCMVVALYEVG